MNTLELNRIFDPKRIIAHTNSDNTRMVTVFKNLGFEIIPGPEGSDIDAVLDL